MFRTFRKLIYFLSLIILAISCSNEEKPEPRPVNGLLDLRNWDFKNDGKLDVHGYWEFRYNEFLSSSQFDSLKERLFTWVPGTWKRTYYQGILNDPLSEIRASGGLQLPAENYARNREKLKGTGYASFRLTLLLPHEQQDLEFILPYVVSAYDFFINDSLVGSCGKVGTSPETSTPRYQRQQVRVNNLKDTTTLTYWVSNFHYRKGGPADDLVLGLPGQIEKEIKNNNFTILFMTGIWFMVCFVLFCFYLYRPKEKAILFLLLWAFSILVRLLTADDRIITEIFPGISFELVVKLELISGFAMAPFACMAMCYLFPGEFSKKIVNFFMITLLIFFVIAILTKSRFYSNLVVPYEFITVATMTYSSFGLVVAIYRRREGALIIGIGMMIALLFFIIQILYYNKLIHLNFRSHVSAVGLVIAFAQMVLIARLFSSALSKIENFAGELENKIRERTEELTMAQDQLLTAARHNENERIRRRISQDIHDDISSGLNKISWLSELVKMKVRNNKVNEVEAGLDKIIRSSKETVDHLIEIIWSLNPVNDDLENMLVYMRNYIVKFFEDTSFNIAINFPELIPKVELNPELKRNLFLVMKEALNNAAKYSEAKNINIEFHYNDSGYTLTISDDGVGFKEGVITGAGNGMINMRKRMDNVNGTFTISSVPGKGTSVVFQGIIY